jgi:hypothetical protein
MSILTFFKFVVYLAAPAILLASTAHAADSRDSDSPFGVLEFLEYNHDWNHYQYNSAEKLEKAASLMQEAGVKFVRITFIWSDIEPQEGSYAFQKYDKLLDLMGRHHIKVLPILAYNSRVVTWNDPPDEARYVAYVKAAVRRYKDKIKYWEIWNEENIPKYWSRQDDLQQYTHLLKAVYPVIKTEDPGAQVLLGGLTGDDAPMALGYIYKNGGKGYFDVMNFHPFVNPLLPNALQEMRTVYGHVRTVMANYGEGEKPIWITEISCPGIPEGVASKGWFEYLGRSPTEAEQAKWVETVYGELLSWKGVKKVFWAGFRDTNDSFHDDVDYIGLIRNDFTKKPAFEEYKKLQTKGHG